jgi:hypothetical protein
VSDEPEDYAEAVAWFNECKTRRVRDKARIAGLEAERDKWEWVARDIAGAFPRAEAILVDATSRWAARAEEAAP